MPVPERLAVTARGPTLADVCSDQIPTYKVDL